MPQADSTTAAPAGARYTCPMHADVAAPAPGSCPACGMALEPLDPAEDDRRAQDAAMRRFWIAAALTAPLMAVAMGGLVPGPAGGWVQLALATPALWAGAPLLARCAESLRTRRLNMYTLIGLGVAAAYGFSAAAVLAPGLFPADPAPVYFEAAAAIVTLALLGEALELAARRRAGDAVRELLALAPERVRRIGPDGAEDDAPAEELRPGDRVRLRPGDRVPCDGAVLEGASAVDESTISGESAPVRKRPGDRLVGGTVNGAGALVMRVEAVGADTVLARIARLVAAAQRSRAPIQRAADRAAAALVPLVAAAAAATFAVWLAAGPDPALNHALVAAVSVLIVACPCAFGLAAPMSVTVAAGRGARAGVLVRDAETLERLAAIDTVVVDKTGTLTEGRPRATRVTAREGFSEAEMLRLAASLERASEHPLAAAVVAAAEGAELLPAAEVEAVPGKGVRGLVAGREVRVGNWRFAGADGSSADSGAAIHVAVDGRPAGAISVADPLRESAGEALAELKRLGVRAVLATGDSRAAADAAAAELGGIEVHAGMTPEDKERLVAELRASGRRVAMAGDGVNDAPALARADVGMAMGTGTGAAIASAGVTLSGDGPRGIAAALRLGRAAAANIRQNLAFAFAYNALAVPVAAGALYPAFGVLLDPMIAAAAMSLSSVSVIGNALRLRRLAL